jgi:hypothetical protein
MDDAVSDTQAHDQDSVISGRSSEAVGAATLRGELTSKDQLSATSDF